MRLHCPTIEEIQWWLAEFPVLAYRSSWWREPCVNVFWHQVCRRAVEQAKGRSTPLLKWLCDSPPADKVKYFLLAFANTL